MLLCIIQIDIIELFILRNHAEMSADSAVL